MKRFIALVLSLVMALSLCVPAWGAESVATFDQLKDAITAGKTDIEVTGQIVLTENLPLTNVTINTGTVEDAFKVPAGYTLTLGAGVTINAAESILYANGGTINIDGATLVSTHTSHALGFVDDGGTINMNSGSVTAYWTGLTASGAGSAVNILGGTVESTNSNATLAKNSGTTTVTGGTIKTHGDFVALWAKDSGVLNVNGGAAISPANGAAISVEGATATVSAGNFSGPVKANAAGSISITGGTFTDSSANSYVSSDKEVVVQDGEYVVVESNSAVAKIGDVKYMSLADAAEAAQPSDTITMLKQDIINETVVLEGVTVNAGSVVDAIKVVDGGTLTLGEGVTIESTVGAILYANGGIINIDGATLKSTSGNNALGFVDAGGTINMNSGSVTAYWTGLTASGAGSAVNILGGTVESTNSNATLAKNSGTTTVTGGTIKTHGDFVALWAKDSGVLNVNGGAAISPANGAAISVEGATATVSAGDFSGPVKANATGKIEISGGKFDVEPDAKYIKEGYEFKNNQVSAVVPTYAVTFDANGGTGTMATATLAAGVEYTLPACTFTAPEGKEFDAWSVGGVNKAVGDKIPISADTVVTALWKDKAPAGGGNDNGGDEGGNTGTITPPSNWWPIGGIATEDKPIESPKTFDAGVVLYVGMSVAAAVGTVTLSKKRED